jgi:hypothetical protein
VTTFAFVATCLIGLIGFLSTIILIGALILADREDRERQRLVVLEGVAWREPAARLERAARN